MTGPDTAATRYSLVAIALHWAMAALLVSMVFYGWWMEDLAHDPGADPAYVSSVYQWHKTAGILILVLTAVRIAWRLTHPVPPLPEKMSRLEKIAARGAHAAFYALMIAMPLAGWITASASGLPTYLFDTAALSLPALPVPQTQAFHELSGSVHGAGGWAILILLTIHALAALKHHFIDRDAVLRQMIGLGAAPRHPAGHWRAGAGAGLGMLALVAGLVLIGGGEGQNARAAASSPGASGWIVDHDASSVRFSVNLGGQTLTGRFGDFSADITLDPERLEDAVIEAAVSTGSVRMPDAQQQGALRGPTGFAPGEYPDARFVSSRITRDADGAYKAEGEFTLKGVAAPLTLRFTLEIEGARAVAEGGFSLDRSTFSIGDATWAQVSETVEVRVHIEADAAPPAQ